MDPNKTENDHLLININNNNNNNTCLYKIKYPKISYICWIFIILISAIGISGIVAYLLIYCL